MIQILINGDSLDLPKGFSIPVEDLSPIFNDRGSQTIPVTVPATPKNQAILGFPGRLDRIASSPIVANVKSGSYYRGGSLNLTEVTEEGYSFNIGFDNSMAYEVWRGTKLKDLSRLPTITIGTGLDALMKELYGIYNGARADTEPLAVFPIAVNNVAHGEGSANKVYWEFLNVPSGSSLAQPTTVRRVVGNELQDVTVPPGYGVTPFLRVWKVLEIIFDSLPVRMLSNPFKDDPTLARLVVLNNAADACCRGEILVYDLLPDCTVQEFLNALWVRFGMVYSLDFDAMTVRVDLIKDIVAQPPQSDITGSLAGHKEITFLSPQYIKLSAKTSLKGATPPAERLEDFAGGSDLSGVRMGGDINQWALRGGAGSGWTGDVADSSPDDDPWSDYDPSADIPDYRDDAAEAIAMMATASAQEVTCPAIAHEFVTGNWFRLDATNGKPKLSGSGFFEWDPRPSGVEALDLASDDECVPVGYANNYATNSGNYFSGKLPMYLTGSRHYHSYIVGDDQTGKDGESTPLAFMFAYCLNGGGTVGRLTPEGDNGLPLNLQDATAAKGSLYFQFKDGLYNTYWRTYDEILRGGVREVRAPVRSLRWQLLGLNLLSIYTLDGVRCLLDKVEYSLPGAQILTANMTLRTAMPGAEMTDRDLGVPNFSAAARRLEWRLLADNCGENLDTLEARTQGAQKYIVESGYVSHGETNDYYRVGNDCLRINCIRQATSWVRDKTIPAPTDITNKLTRQYKARLIYDVYEAHDGLCDDGTEETTFSATPIGQVSVDVDYTAVIAPKWVMV